LKTGAFSITPIWSLLSNDLYLFRVLPSDKNYARLFGAVTIRHLSLYTAISGNGSSFESGFSADATAPSRGSAR
jgi:hypothetical protein